MKLPDNFQAIAGDGARTLAAIAVRLWHRAEETPNMPELWLAVRDVDSLAGRVGQEQDAWELGIVRAMLGGQDFGVLDELIQRDPGEPLTKYAAVTESEATHLRDLRGFLHSYQAGAFERDSSAS